MNKQDNAIKEAVDAALREMEKEMEGMVKSFEEHANELQNTMEEITGGQEATTRELQQQIERLEKELATTKAAGPTSGQGPAPLVGYLHVKRGGIFGRGAKWERHHFSQESPVVCD